jgi:hypothetical protein
VPDRRRTFPYRIEEELAVIYQNPNAGDHVTLLAEPPSGNFWSISMRFTPRFLPRNATGHVLVFLCLAALIAHSQDAAKPTPHVSYDGPALKFDFPEVKIGVAEYEEGPTGTTVLYLRA